jgi:hypothetical protein
MCLYFYSVIFWFVEGSIPSRLRRKVPTTPTPSLPEITLVGEASIQPPPVEGKESMGRDLYCETPYTLKEHIKWCGASEETIISMHRFQKEVAGRRAKEYAGRGSRSGLISDEETLLDGEPVSKVPSVQ